MHDDWIMRRPALGAINRGHRALVPCIRAEAIDSFGRKRDQTALSQKGNGGADAPVAVTESDRIALSHAADGYWKTREKRGKILKASGKTAEYHGKILEKPRRYSVTASCALSQTETGLSQMSFDVSIVTIVAL